MWWISLGTRGSKPLPPSLNPFGHGESPSGTVLLLTGPSDTLLMFPGWVLSGSATVSSLRLAKPCVADPSLRKSPSSRPAGHTPITTNIAFISPAAHVGNV